MSTRARPPSGPVEWTIRVGGVIGLILLILSRRRWDWVYPDPNVPWRAWQGFAGLVLCVIAGVWTLWHRASPYSVDTQDDEDATVTLGLNRRDEDRN